MQKVVTHVGIKPADKVLPGDYLYEYGTSEMMEVVDIEIHENEKIWDVRYSDKRVEKVGEDELIYFDGKLHSPNDLYGEIDRIIPIERYVCDFGKLIPPVKPDAYSAGAILAYADIFDDYVNIPNTKTTAENHILHVNGWNVYPEAAKDKIYFMIGDSNQKLTWADVFAFKSARSNMAMFMIDHHMDSPIIPYEYTYGKVEDRIKFIRGVFDTGYSRDITPDRISITMTDDIRMRTIQRMLWSLGIMSYMHSNNGIFQLDILGPEEDYASFFYDFENRARMIDKDFDIYKSNPIFKLYVESVTPSLIVRKEPIYHFRVAKRKGARYVVEKNALYYSDQFLPRLTL